jgi:hypothetical protein
MPTTREKEIKLLVAKFVKLVESLNPGERLAIRKVGAAKTAKTKSKPAKAKVQKPAESKKPAAARARAAK